MKQFIAFVLTAALFVYSCSESKKNNTSAQSQQSASSSMISSSEQATQEFNGFKSQLELGENLVATGDCDVCHSPKKMTDHGPAVDSSLRLSGHPANMTAPQFPGIKDAQAKGYTITQTLTSWVGPWGISYAANLTPDKTGIGNWSEDQFIKAIRQGKYRGMDNTRPLMPPMPWEAIAKHRDYELKAIFAYLKSLKPISNVVPGYQPPTTMAKK